MEEAEALKSLKSQVGWGLIEKEVEEVVNAVTEALISCKDMNEIVRLQERIKFHRGLIEWVNAKIHEGELAQEYLKQLEQSEME